MDYSLFRERLQIITGRINEIGGKVQELIIDPPASQIEILRIENQIGYQLPASYKKVLLEFSSNFSLRWFLPDRFSMPGKLGGIFSGRPHWGLSSTLEIDAGKEDWVKNVFANPLDNYDKVWHNKLAFLDVGNGDYIAFDLNGDEDPPIVYLSHDDGEGHGCVIGKNFIEFVNDWSRLAFVGSEDWKWLPFTMDKHTGLDPECDLAREFRKLLNLKL